MRTIAEIAADARECADRWIPEVCLIGNVTAGEIVALASAVSETLARAESAEAALVEARSEAAARTIERDEARGIIAYIRECDGGPELLQEAKALEPVRQSDLREEVAELRRVLTDALDWLDKMEAHDPALQPGGAASSFHLLRGCAREAAKDLRAALARPAEQGQKRGCETCRHRSKGGLEAFAEPKKDGEG